MSSATMHLPATIGNCTISRLSSKNFHNLHFTYILLPLSLSPLSFPFAPPPSKVIILISIHHGNMPLTWGRCFEVLIMPFSPTGYIYPWVTMEGPRRSWYQARPLGDPTDRHAQILVSLY